jgi:uncharacterized MnhB-related membrane protein
MAEEVAMTEAEIVTEVLVQVVVIVVNANNKDLKK